VIVGARKDEQLADNLGAVNVHLSGEDIDRLDQVSAPDLIYPHWHQANAVSSRFSEPDLALHRPAR
ncbi:aldo/keto reductase, partial [Streptomyces sp. NPDC004457]